MANKQIATITGLDEVIRFFDEMPKLVCAIALGNALHSSIQVFQEAVEELTPSQTIGPLPKGERRLRGSTVTDVEVDKQGRGGRAQVGFGKLGYIARFVEYGHKKVLWGRRTDGRVEPHPFMRPAFEVAYDRAIDAFCKSLERDVNRQLNNRIP